MKGTYFLLIEVKKDLEVKVGALGNVPFKQGMYVYVGSGLKNLEARLDRHRKMSKGKSNVRRWHVDYLLSHPRVELLDVYYKKGEKREECKTAKHFAKLGKPVKGFGSSDCNCGSHLFYLS